MLGKLLMLVCENHTETVSTACGQNYLPRNFKRGVYGYYPAIWVYKGEQRSEILENMKYTHTQCINRTLQKRRLI